MTDNEKDRQSSVISCSEAATLPGLFCCRVARTPDAIAYQQYDTVEQKWQSFCWSGMQEKISCWQQALLSEGFEPGDRVAIYLKNSIEWVCCEQAVLSLGLVVVPLYSLDTPQSITSILQDSGSRLLLVDSMEQWQALSEFYAALPNLSRVVCLADGGKDVPPKGLAVSLLADWLPDSGGSMCNLATDPHGLATIIYTSGTTGKPKGVMLSHHNILWDAEAILKVVAAYTGDVFLSFLPLSHAFERTVGYYVPMMAGSQVVFARSVKDLADDLLAIRPTVLISVPRIYERVYGRIHDKLDKKGDIAQKMFTMTEEVGWRRFQDQQHRRVSGHLLDPLLWPALQRAVAQKVLNRLGGRVRLAVTGGAPLHEKVAHLFIGLGLPLLQGYGLTESGPVVSANTLTNNLPSSVGAPLPGCEVKVAADNELLVRSPAVMLGYWQRPDATTEVIDSDGWLHTGDMVKIEDERIFIRGRLKEILVTSTGEKIPPANVEMTITEDPLFFQAMLVGEGKPYFGALIVVDRQGWKEFAAECSLDAEDLSSLHSEVAETAVLARLRSLLSSFPSYAQVRAVHLLADSWTFEQGLVTSLMKLKRHEIAKRFSREIAALYAGHQLPEW